MKPPCRKRLRRELASLACALACSAFFMPAAAAHDARPLSVNITEQSKGLYLARLRVPPTVQADNQPKILWPDGCSVIDDEWRPEPTPVETLLVRCDPRLDGRQVRVRYAIYNPSLSTLFRLSDTNGDVVSRVLPPDRLDWQVPEEPGWREVAAGYLGLGVQHIWTGIDHLLFVAGLLILAGTTYRILLAITGFTLAHSITLSLSALGVVRLPIPPVEAAIALSILVLAREIARPDANGLTGRFPILVSSSFGLLHGFGFAAALREVGLPTRELAVGLLCFNAGVEIGQIVFIAALLTIVFAARQIAALGRLPLLGSSLRWEPLCGYALGVPAAFWLLQRLAAF